MGFDDGGFSALTGVGLVVDICGSLVKSCDLAVDGYLSALCGVDLTVDVSSCLVVESSVDVCLSAIDGC